MADTVCRGCGGIMDITGIDPFTVCECSDCGTEIIIPLEIDYLKLEKPLGVKCGFEVYEGFDQAHNLNSIIYILKKDMPEYKFYVDLAKSDALALTTLKHPNICPILNCGEVQDNFFVSQPRMDGYNLDSYSPDSQGLLDIDSVVNVIQASILGLAVAHHKEFMHHNITAECIHIDARGNVRINDFFISRFNYNVLQNHPDSAFEVSPYYISPEKAESKVEDKRGDVFSFGVLFYYMLTGKYPFAGKTSIETIYSRVKRKKTEKTEIFNQNSHRIVTQNTVDYVNPATPSEIRFDIPGDLSSIVMDMLSYHPVQRPKFTEILATLNLFIAKGEKEKVVHSAQKEMVATKTRAIPVMKKLYDSDSKKGGKGKKWGVFQ